MDRSRSGHTNRSSAQVQTPREDTTPVSSEHNAPALNESSVLASRKRRRRNPLLTERLETDNFEYLQQPHISTSVDFAAVPIRTSELIL